MAAVSLAGMARTAAAPAAQAQVAAGGLGNIMVPCSTDSLAAAISNANSHGGATLTLPAHCIFSITAPSTVADGPPLITASIALLGGPGTVISRDPVAAFRILDIAAGGALRVSSVAIQNGSTAGLGGGIQNAGNLQLNQVLLSGNSAANGGGVANISGSTANIYPTVFDRNTA